ncbi:MAG: hydrogenase subunit MbhD domain-containing protein [Thermoplasmatota archaeon]
MEFYEFLYNAVHFMVLLGIVASALMVVKFKDLISAAIALAACSLLVSLEFFILQAPDVAIAEAAVGAGLTTAIIIFAIKGTRRREEY